MAAKLSTCKLSASCMLMILHKQKIKAYSEISLIFCLKAINFWHFENVKTIVIYLGKQIELHSEAYAKKKAQSYPKLWPMIVHISFKFQSGILKQFSMLGHEISSYNNF